MLRKLLVGFVIAFALFYLFTQPNHAAAAVRGVGAAVGVAFQSVIQFFNALFA